MNNFCYYRLLLVYLAHNVTDMNMSMSLSRVAFVCMLLLKGLHGLHQSFLFVVVAAEAAVN